MIREGTSPAPSYAEQLRAQYRANCRQPLDQDALLNWRPQANSWKSLQAMIALAVPSLKTQELMVANHRLRFWDLGQSGGEPIVLLHGFGASKENWLMLAPLLARSHRLLIPDIPGFGQSDFVASDSYTVEAQVERLALWLEQIDAGPVHLVGSSMGGAIAGVLAAHQPLRVKSLTLMNSAGVAGESPSSFEQALWEGENRLVPSSYSEVFRLFRLASHRNRQLLSCILTPLMFREMTGRALVNHRIFHDLLDSSVDSMHLLPKVQCPALICWGDQDQVIDVSCTDTLKTLMPHAQTRILRNVGHLPMLEVPRLTAAALQRFWRAAHHDQLSNMSCSSSDTNYPSAGIN